ncbi:MAG: SCO family protein [Acidobacteria bacterium]|nr:SCO family protein [Acidobacteriota bacterium]
MRAHTLFSAAALSFLAAAISGACGGAPPRPGLELHGQILSVDPAAKTARIKHEEIKGFMPGMTMPYAVRDGRLLEGLAPGDLVDATLVVGTNDAYLSAIAKVGAAPLGPESPGEPAPSAASGFELLKPGEAVPPGRFVDQDGRARDFTSFKGQAVVVTFMYTKCPMPAFCPLLDRNFAAIQRSLASDPAAASLRGRVRLVSVSFDPLTDTPPVLQAHAERLQADPQVWTFLTGERDDIDRFGARFGVQVVRDRNNPLDITHNLRTAIVDPEGRFVAAYTGNGWTPEQVIADLKPVAGVR